MKNSRIITTALSVFFLMACNKQMEIKPEKKTIIDAVFASGHVITKNEYIVSANTEGFLLESFIHEGDTIAKNQSLFLLSNEKQNAQLDNARSNYNDALRKSKDNSPELAQLKLQVEQAKEQLKIDETNYKRYKNLRESNAVSQLDFERIELQFNSSRKNVEILSNSYQERKKALLLNVENAESQLRIQQETTQDYSLTASTEGTVLNVYKKEGEFISRGLPIARIGSGELRAKLFIAEEDIKLITIGQKVIISLNTYKNEPVEAFITEINPAFSTEEQSFIAEAILPDFKYTIYPGTQLQANIIVQQKEDALVIPTPYMVDGNQVILKSRKKTKVTIGIQNQEWTEILSGIDLDDTILMR